MKVNLKKKTQTPLDMEENKIIKQKKNKWEIQKFQKRIEEKINKGYINKEI